MNTRRLLFGLLACGMASADLSAQVPVARVPSLPMPIPGGSGGTLWADVPVGAGFTSTATISPDTIIISGFTETTYNLLGSPVAGMTFFPSPHAVITDGPTLWWLGGVTAQEALLFGTSGEAPLFAGGYDCFGTIQEIYAVTNSYFHVLTGGAVTAYALPAVPIAMGVVSQDFPAFQTCETVVVCDSEPLIPGVEVWWQLNGTFSSTGIATDPVGPVEMFHVPYTGGAGGVASCAGAVVFESDAVTVIQGGVGTTQLLPGVHAGHTAVAGGFQVDLVGGGSFFVSVLCPSGQVPATQPITPNGLIDFLNAPGSKGVNMGVPPPLVL